MEVTSRSFEDGSPIPDRYAFAVPADEGHVTFGDNVNPHLAWSDVPEGTRSFVITCMDGVVPTKPDDVNKEGREVPPDLLRTDFVHWVVVDLPEHVREISEGEFAAGVEPGGRDATGGPHGCKQGLNDYTSWFSGDPDMEGIYLGYDGPAPPWNDSLVHEYDFTVYALDVDRLPVFGGCTAAETEAAMEGHILGKATIRGLYTLNPRLR